MSDTFCLGVHVTKISKVLDDKKAADTLYAAINRDIDELELNAVQIFTHGPRNSRANNIDYKQIEETCSDLDLSVHSSYGSVSIWKITPANKTTTSSVKTMKLIIDQLKACEKIGAWGLVIHVNKQLPRQVAYVMSLLKKYAKGTGVKIILEMVSSKTDGNKTYESPDKINNLTELIGVGESWWCWCVDTAHLWGAGVDIQSYDNMKRWLDDIKYPDKVEMFHLNGSSAVMGSGKDKHEILFSVDDKIWHNINEDDSGAKAVIEFAYNYGSVVICEINRGTETHVKEGIQKIKDILDSF